MLFLYCLASRKLVFVHPIDMGTIKSCTWLECFEHNGMLLHAYCGLSVHAAGILCHSVVGKMYYLVYVHLCLQHPLVYKQVTCCNIYSIVWLADFQFKLYIREGGAHSFLFFYEGGSSFYNFLQWGGSLTFLESF